VGWDGALLFYRCGLARVPGSLRRHDEVLRHASGKLSACWREPDSTEKIGFAHETQAYSAAKLGFATNAGSLACLAMTRRISLFAARAPREGRGSSSAIRRLTAGRAWNGIQGYR